MAENYEMGLPSNVTAQLEVHVKQPEFHSVHEPETIKSKKKDGKGEGCEGHGIAVTKLANVSFQSLRMATFLIAQNDGHFCNRIRQTKTLRALEATVLLRSQPSRYVSVSRHASVISHLKAITVESHKSKTSQI